MRVVLVEDEALLLEGLLLTTPWADWGLEVAGTAEDGLEGMEKILALRPDIVLTDVKMPHMSGLEMIEALRGRVDCEYIILSGYDEFSFVKKAIHLEVHEYLLKPVDDQELKEALYNAMEKVRRRRPAEPLDERSVQDRYLSRARQILKERYAENLTLKSVADGLFISDSYLGKLFKSKTGMTFLEMLTLYRIRAAVDDLQNTDKKVYEIANDIGYSDAKYFSRVFQRVTGMKPMELKNGRRLPAGHILLTLP